MILTLDIVAPVVVAWSLGSLMLVTIYFLLTDFDMPMPPTHCPWCEKEIYKGESKRPLSGRCKFCGNHCRLIGNTYVKIRIDIASDGRKVRSVV
jgi:hypothetical protein